MEGLIVMAKKAELSAGYNDGRFPQVLDESGLHPIEGNTPSLTEECSDAKI
jgi:hypothetical protein